MRRRAFVALLLALSAGRAAGHAMPSSTVVLRSDPAGMTVTAAIPVSELEAALGHPLRRAELEGYARSHIALEAADGRPFGVHRVSVVIAEGEHPQVRVAMRFVAPEGPPAGPATMRYIAVMDRIASHYALVYLRDTRGLRKPLVRLQAPTLATVVPRQA
jgi:hypothetical protein